MRKRHRVDLLVLDDLVLRRVPRQSQVCDGGLAVAIAMRRKRWGRQDVLSAPTCAGCGWQRHGLSYVN
jgi:hypothetical protein